MIFAGICLMAVSCASNGKKAENDAAVKLITLDPGHFHAALVQKRSYPQVDNNVYVYAPQGDDLKEHLKKVEAYNNREDDPTSWNEVVYAGDDFLQKMIDEKKGNVVVLAGNNKEKVNYIEKSLDAGFNVLADKPMAIDPAGFRQLQKCFDKAKEKGLVFYDIMTERNEITTMLQKELSMVPSVYGAQLQGTPQEPAFYTESVHHLYKEVSGVPLIRPDWFYDVECQGEGIVDVTTHLVDLVQWETFPGQSIDYDRDIELLDANRWPTPVSLKQFTMSTTKTEFPDFLKKYVKDDVLDYYCNGDILYKIKGVTAKVSVTWEFSYPEGGGDTHYSIMKGSKADLIIRQGKEQSFRPELYIEAVKADADYGKALEAAIAKLAEKYPGIALANLSEGKWQVTIPDVYRVGHEAHFGQVMDNYLEYLQNGNMPEWEVPGMIAKYRLTTSALEMARSKK